MADQDHIGTGLDGHDAHVGKGIVLGHGAHVFDTLPLKRELRPLSEAVTGDPALSSPVKQAAQRAEFFDAYARQPFQQVRNHYLAAQLLSGSRKQGARPGKKSEKPSLFTSIKERLWKKH